MSATALSSNEAQYMANIMNEKIQKSAEQISLFSKDELDKLQEINTNPHNNLYGIKINEDILNEITQPPTNEEVAENCRMKGIIDDMYDNKGP